MNVFVECPTPWCFGDGQVRDAVGDRVWDVADANDSPEVAMAVTAVINAACVWAKARRTLLELPERSPDFRARLNDLSNAEDALREAVEQGSRRGSA